MHLLPLLLRWERILLSLHRLTLLREWCLLLITTLHRLLLVALHGLLNLTRTLHLPASDIVEVTLLTLLSLDIEMRCQLLALLDGKLLNLLLTKHAEHDVLRVLALFVT